MEENLKCKFEEWKVVRSTIVEFDNILSKIRYLDITITVVLFGAAFEYSNIIFILIVCLNLCLFFLELHYHKYLNEIANYAKELEKDIGFKLTHKISVARDEYKRQKNLRIRYIFGWSVANISYVMYFLFMLIALLLFYCTNQGEFIENNCINIKIKF